MKYDMHGRKRKTNAWKKIESDIGVKLTKDNVMQHYREIIRMPNIGKVYVNQLRTYLDTA